MESTQLLLGADLKGHLEDLCVWYPWLQEWKPQLVSLPFGTWIGGDQPLSRGSSWLSLAHPAVVLCLNWRYRLVIDPCCEWKLDQKAVETYCWIAMGPTRVCHGVRDQHVNVSLVPEVPAGSKSLVQSWCRAHLQKWTAGPWWSSYSALGWCYDEWILSIRNLC